MTPRCDVLVIGGGVIGVCSAFSLAERGASVILVERDEVCSGCSHGNAGWLFPSHSMPIPAPGVMRQGLRWLLDPESPLFIRPRASPALARWLWRFARACTETRMRTSYKLTRDLSLASLERYAELAALPELAFGFARGGLAIACETQEALDEAREELEILAALGGHGDVLSTDALRERVPLLAKDLAGGVYLPADGHLTPGDFVRGLARACEARGVEVRTHTEVLSISQRASGSHVETTRGAIEALDVVLAAGAWSPALVPELHLPIEPAKGYSRTVERPEGFGELPVMLAEARVGVTPMGEHLRFAGTLELAGLDPRIHLRRVRAIERSVRRFLPDLPETRLVEVWRGFRPLTPDDLPIIGRPGRQPGLVLATGHGMKGIAQGPITGELVAALVSGERPAFDLAPLHPDRFS